MRIRRSRVLLPPGGTGTSDSVRALRSGGGDSGLALPTRSGGARAEGAGGSAAPGGQGSALRRSRRSGLRTAVKPEDELESRKVGEKAMSAAGITAGAMSAGVMAPGAAARDGRVGAVLRTMALPVAAISVLFVMIVPVPAFVMDMLLACSMAASILVFLSAVQLRRAVDFSVFPTLLLLLTLFRLSLNIASAVGSYFTATRGRRRRAKSSKPSASLWSVETTSWASCCSWP